MIYDGDCGFCTRWIHRWQRRTGDRIDYQPSQAPQLPARFPEIPRAELDAAVHLIVLDGSVYSGAEAVFRSLALASRARWLLGWYQHSTAFAQLTEAAYRFVARHRRFFSLLS